MDVLWHDEGISDERNDSQEKRAAGDAPSNACYRGKASVQVSSKWKHEQSGQYQSTGSDPVVLWIIAWRNKVGNYAVAPVIAFRKHRCTEGQDPEERNNDQTKQNDQSGSASKHSGKMLPQASGACNSFPIQSKYQM
jgi:hypothetical protein